MLKIVQFQFSQFGVNTYLVIDDATSQAAVIDPAMAFAQEERAFSDYVAKEKVDIRQIINTHLHLDHCFGMDYVKSKYSVPLKAHGEDAILGEILDQQYQMFGMEPRGRKVGIDVTLRDNDMIDIGESHLQVLATPGHTLGGICLYSAADKILFSGDTIFKGSVGRTDLPGGSHSSLISSIKRKILSLPHDVRIYPGHGPSTTVGDELRHNPFI
ncbi:MAG: MBL fold metallo-hydrolase [Muribaculaceae bacterium]|nr:MBL fold metallo-hydrolase [Muribaculaceae bacterium]